MLLVCLFARNLFVPSCCRCCCCCCCCYHWCCCCRCCCSFCLCFFPCWNHWHQFWIRQAASVLHSAFRRISHTQQKKNIQRRSAVGKIYGKVKMQCLAPNSRWRTVAHEGRGEERRSNSITWRLLVVLLFLLLLLLLLPQLPLRRQWQLRNRLEIVSMHDKLNWGGGARE